MAGTDHLPRPELNSETRLPITYRPRTRTDLIILHDSHTGPEVIRPMDHLRWKGRTKGLLEIGYHLIIDREGYAHQIRPIDVMGSHTPGFNHRSVGVCLVGGLDAEGRHSDDFTPAQMKSLRWYLQGFRTEWPGVRIVGHSEIQSRRGQHVCPAIDMDQLRGEL